uniref:Hsp101 n=1 Tax=Arundo donax TaxID=35708 RepID=A0A0A9F052_ARUDO
MLQLPGSRGRQGRT